MKTKRIIIVTCRCCGTTFRLTDNYQSIRCPECDRVEEDYINLLMDDLLYHRINKWKILYLNLRYKMPFILKRKLSLFIGKILFKINHIINIFI